MKDILPSKPMPKLRPPRHDLRKIPLLRGEENAVEEPSKKINRTRKLKVPKVSKEGD